MKHILFLAVALISSASFGMTVNIDSADPNIRIIFVDKLRAAITGTEAYNLYDGKSKIGAIVCPASSKQSGYIEMFDSGIDAYYTIENECQAVVAACLKANAEAKPIVFLADKKSGLVKSVNYRAQ